MEFLGRSRATEGGAEAARPLSITQLNKRVRTLLEGELPRVWIEGAVSRPVRAASGHLYFGLQDDGARVDAVMWAQRARDLKFPLVDGLQIRARGLVTVYPPSGKYQVVVDEMEPAGEGARERRLKELRAKLAAEGLFDPTRKRVAPFLPQCVALVTSPTGAAVRDLLRVIFRRFPEARVLIVPVRVQGEGSADEIAEGVRRAAAFPATDVIVVGRGGGAAEDLWAFNEEVVARAIFGSRVPVVSAVGHEIDVTVADDVADLRAATPSEAGERVVPVSAEIEARLAEAADRLAAGVARTGRAARSALDAAAARAGFAGFGRRFDDERQRLDELDVRLCAALRGRVSGVRDRAGSLGRLLNAHRPGAALGAMTAAARVSGARLVRALLPTLAAARARVDAAGRSLASLDPTAVLARGFSLTWATDDRGGRRLLRAADELRDGERLRSTFARGDDLLSDPAGTAPRAV